MALRRLEGGPMHALDTPEAQPLKARARGRLESRRARLFLRWPGTVAFAAAIALAAATLAPGAVAAVPERDRAIAGRPAVRRKTSASLDADASENGTVEGIGSPLPAASPCLESGDGDEEEEEDDEHVSGAFGPMIFFAIAFLVAALVDEVTSCCKPGHKLPRNASLIICGTILGFVGAECTNSEFGDAITGFMKMDPKVLLWVFLPAVLYKASSQSSWHVMRCILPNIMLIAVPGFFMNTLLLGALIKLSFGTVPWHWNTVFILGGVISTTDLDPIANVHGHPRTAHLSLLISGEAQINAGSCLVLYYFALQFLGSHSLSAGESVAFLLRLFLGGPLIGLGMGIAAFLWLRQTQESSIEVLIILAGAYGSFFLAEHEAVMSNGFFATVTYGFFMHAQGRFALNIEENHRYAIIVQFIARISNSAIFVIAGVMGAHLFRSMPHILRDWLELLLLYVFIFVSRATVLAMCSPLLQRCGFGMTWKELIFMTLASIRGVAGLTMAAIVAARNDIGQPERMRICFHCFGAMVLTLVING
eukprot:NODE_6075_length_1708_cov_4.024668.p1 GENE.NODE_6075_length_1708_cov_4.024668~~NODE_6075_length_1708_cov_4.024668.p1  ORF type:complete len:535 (+),score=119.96 NODE_6075_length_1708_cov_4.024668:101-1705(+)